MKRDIKKAELIIAITAAIAAGQASVGYDYSCWRRPKTEPLMRVVPTQN